MIPLKLFFWLVCFTQITLCNCSDLSANNRQLLDHLEKSILASFGLDERPKVDKSKVNIHPYMFHLYNQRVRQNLEEKEEMEASHGKSRASSKYSKYYEANTVRSYTHSESLKDQLHPSHEMIFQFNVSNVPLREMLRGAELRLEHLQHPSSSVRDKYIHVSLNSSKTNGFPTIKTGRQRWSKEEFVYLSRIRVYDILRPQGHLPHVNRLLDTRVVDARVNGTVVFDVSAALKRWLRKPHTNHGLFVEVVPLKSDVSIYKDAAHVRLRRNAEEEDTAAGVWEQHQPLLVLHTDDRKLRPREKRNAPVPSYKRPHCRRYSLHVDFRKVDWDTWIVAPSGYGAFFCEGDCPYPLAKHMNATNHAVIQNIIHSRYPNRVPSACCVPIKYSAISMLYLDKDGEIALKTYQDMIVEACGCQ